MEDEGSTITSDSSSVHPSDLISLPSSIQSHRYQMRRSLLRHTALLRSSPYSSTSSNSRRRHASAMASQAVSNLITDIDPSHMPTNAHASPSDASDTDMSRTATEHSPFSYLAASTDEGDFEALVNRSATPDIDREEIMGEPSDSRRQRLHLFPIQDHHHHRASHEENDSYHSLATADFDPDDDAESDEDDDDDDDARRFYYTSTTSALEPIIVRRHPIEIVRRAHFDEYPPAENLVTHQLSDENDNDEHEEELSIEIILETSQTHSLSTPPVPPIRRRQSIVPSNIIYNRGLRLSDIISIPTKIYSSLKDSISAACQSLPTMINAQCYICLDEFQSMDSIKILHCQHVFHA